MAVVTMLFIVTNVYLPLFAQDGQVESEEFSLRTEPIAPVTLHSFPDEQKTKKQAHLQYFSNLTKNPEIAQIILREAKKNKIDPALAFALSWEESRFKTTAVNRNTNTSVDRGLFQLNNRAFPTLSEKDFFNPQTNVHYGLAHLRYCIESSGNDIAGLAMYNAGPVRVRNNKTPKQTLDYISRILKQREAFATGLKMQGS